MERIKLDEKWTFRRGFCDNLGMIKSDPGVEVNLPHDGMIGTAVTADAPAQMDMGYFTGGISNYTKYVNIPEEWENESIGLRFDGAMMNVTVDVNGFKAGRQHYGYAPFYVDLTDLVTFGKENRITINVNTSMQPNSRWYTGSGLYRGVELVHGPKVHIANDGIFVYTKEVADGHAFLEAQVDVRNETAEKRLAEIELSLVFEDKIKALAQKDNDAEDKDDSFFCSNNEQVAASVKKVIWLDARSTGTARIAFSIKNPLIWDVDDPNLYTVKATVKNLGVYRTHFVADPKENCIVDEASTLFGIKTVTVDAVRGLLINGKSVKLKGGCLHHDNGLLGSVSLYEIEARKVKKLKEIGFNAIRTTHNPPSSALIEACDRLGMYVFDEAFDAWGMAKRSGDYSQFFDADWEKDLTAFVRRDRTHPCVVIWSIGNEIPERGGLNNGYDLAKKLAEKVRSLDGTRPVSNGICSFWSGLDDELAEGLSWFQNSIDGGLTKDFWEKGTEPFTDGLDIVGYNYMEDFYERDHELFPDRVILGSENFPKEIGFRWPLVEKHPYIIGDFTWTAWDYIGEAGLGKSVYLDPEDPFLKKGPYALMPQESSPYPWRTANDADFDITGTKRPQGAYRSVVWGSSATHLYTVHPKNFGKVEMIGPWGFTDVLSCWNYTGYEGKTVELVVFSNAQEVEILINGDSIGRKKVSSERPLPNSVRFEAIYKPGKVEAISYTDGKEVSRDILETTGEPVGLRLTPEKKAMQANGHDVLFMWIEAVDSDGRVVPDAAVPVNVKVEGSGTLAGLGTGNPITDEDYTDNETVTYHGKALAIIRSGYEKGETALSVASEGLAGDSAKIKIF
ncbi:MAG: DUF4982 domain-containing protein [Lachnospiraceae bacterium]|nr:DUF4982 domain-containing protein [Lachnospiraceae bacterium]